MPVPLSVALCPPEGSAYHQKGPLLGLVLQASSTSTTSSSHVPQQSLASPSTLNHERSHQRGSFTTMLPQQGILCSKTTRRKTPHHRSFLAKSSHPLPFFQDARCQHDQAFHPQASSFHVSRHHRRISSHTNPSQIRKICRFFNPKPSFLLSVVDKNGQPSTTGAPLASNSNPDRLNRRIRF